MKDAGYEYGSRQMICVIQPQLLHKIESCGLIKEDNVCE